MDVFFDNFWWMGINLGLALLGLIFAILFLHSKNHFFKLIYLILWVLFVPNTIYIITDIMHLSEQFPDVNVLFRILLVVQYLLFIGLGVAVYIASVYPIEVYFSKKKRNQKTAVFFIFLFNFLIAFAVAIGKIERTNSWYIITDPLSVLRDLYLIAAAYQTMFFVLVFGIILNILYFYIIRLFRKDLSKIFKA